MTNNALGFFRVARNLLQLRAVTFWRMYMFQRLTALALILIVATSEVARGDATSDNLIRMCRQYGAIKSLHCTIAIKHEGPGAAKRNGKYEFWLDGNKYRFRVTTSPPLGWADWDVRWDGERLQMLNIENSALILSKDVHHPLPMVPVNPLLYPYQFLFANSGPSLGTRMTWQDASDIKTFEDIKAAKELSGKTPNIVTAEYPGGKFMDFGSEVEEEYKYLIEFGGTSPAFMPSKVEAVSKTGSVLLRTDITYQAVNAASGPITLPKAFSYKVFKDDKSVGYRISGDIAIVDVDKPIPAETFTVNVSEVQAVNDDDAAATRPSEAGFRPVHPASAPRSQSSPNPQ